MLGDRTEAFVPDSVTSRIDRIRNRTTSPRPKVASEEAMVSSPVTKNKPVYHTDRPIVKAVKDAKTKIQTQFMESLNLSVISQYEGSQLKSELLAVLDSILTENKVILNQSEKNELVELFIDDMFGLGPLQPLIDDESVTDIMVNSPDEVYVERNGLLEKTEVTFRDHVHISNIATRIATRVGRRVDESTPMVDARLQDGSRVNIVLPPLSFKSPTISIRKFSDMTISLDQMVQQNNMSRNMAEFLKLATRSRMNILVSGGTGSGKTTLLNAMSEFIDPYERIITIEDAAELRLTQPHVVTLETRPSNIEGKGKITIRDLLINSLRMRPDRIIVGEVRGDEVIDMLQAMNTGHDGSLGTVHANSARDALSRLENLYAMSGCILPTVAVRAQITSAIDIVVQTERMSDGKRRITSITEISSMEGDIITTHNLYTYEYKRDIKSNKINGDFVFHGLGNHSKDKIIRVGYGDHLEKIC